ncbi:MAG: hypothetical protein IT379_16085 [Deltaproteobacteria bacterium]|nr:hypothetical protein [Deltaproteobacteria bacterium]
MEIVAGGFHTCGVRADGRVECWGDDTFGQSTPPRSAALRSDARGG